MKRHQTHSPTQTEEAELAALIPVAGDTQALESLLATIAGHLPIYIIDGSGDPATATLAETYQCQYVQSELGRGQQIAAGIDQAQEDWIWILHADSEVKSDVVFEVKHMCSRSSPAWGRCDVFISGLNIVAWSMNFRSRITGICTGDQGMYFHRELINDIGGFPRQPLMEDVEVSKRLRRCCHDKYCPLKAKIGTSNRRWKTAGVLRTIGKMWWFRLLYFVGVPSQRLYDRYYPERASFEPISHHDL